MNGALYISFFQGQLESALEQVVQLAVQEITKTVGATLNSMLLETAAKDQENQRLRLKLQSSELECNKGHGKAATCKGGRETNLSCEETKPEQHTPTSNRERSMQADTLWTEQKGRAVGQLKVVMEQVLEFALTELTKIVEDSFDDLLLELTKVEHENGALSDRLRMGKKRQHDAVSCGKSDGTDSKRNIATVKKEVDNDSDSPGSSEGVRQQPPRGREWAAKITRAKQHASNDTANAGDPADTEKQKVLAVAQDWVPILDKVFGQKWCSETWHIKDVEAASLRAKAGGDSNMDGDAVLALSPLGPSQMSTVDALIRETLVPSHPTGQRQSDESPSWLGSDDLDARSPSSENQAVQVVDPIDGVTDLRSPSMLHRLLTLPSQLLEGDEESMEGQPAQTEPACDSPAAPIRAAASSPQVVSSPPLTLVLKAKEKKMDTDEEDEEDEEEVEEDISSDTDHCFSPRGSRGGSGRKSHACKQCGKRFSRALLLKAHKQTHDTASALRCPDCGKRFTHQARLQAHLRTHRDHQARGRREPL